MWSELFGTLILLLIAAYVVWLVRDDILKAIDDWEPPTDDE